MSQATRAVLLSIGEELLDGRILDTNAVFFAQELLRAGLQVDAMHTIGDAPSVLATELKRLDGGSASVLISTGGLGPTADDRVRADFAAALGVDLEPIPGALEVLQELWSRHHQGLAPAVFLAQGFVPVGCRPLANSRGTAWGFAGRLPQGLRFWCLPGPPHECRAVWATAGPVIDGKPSDGAAALVDLAGTAPLELGLFHTVGRPESWVESQVADLMQSHADPRMGIVASADKVTLSVLTHGGRAALDEMATLLKERLGDVLWGRDEETLVSVIVNLLAARGQTVTFAESCSGGRISAALTSVPGASAVMGHGFVTYSNEAKESMLRVSHELLLTHGAVSSPVAEAMAMGAKKQAQSDWAVSVTGIAGPGGGTAEKPVGLVYIAIVGPDGRCHTARRKLWSRGGRDGIQRQTVRDALDSLRRGLLGLPPL
ncbi:MAG: nicotinamide-nucleotide amidohydrolase family protein [Planctomycetes bacterium]|nr:nicotinamide-nucleotide amidohydrolase family protein [Planctomycetota bacterium]MBT4029424.1 nicotinamide-nucleotide amidohydrolase family protein [Planctomycetota bacterium]MBT4559967.1 nicotinamide-nucleotide amidohydrolase family protein [Planctomycetota bacterium]MBT5101378.1 nicotinamide-nucleotide amidohydrolase family protein [Planctomycetota bacterium]MBT5120549.1 nicotinamide-nucleotide amidohydrolase family protein [Planctomycetota bacterium]